jgi:hypothetical protein
MRADRDNGTRKRPGDLVLDLGDGPTFIDVTVANPFNATLLTTLAGNPASVALMREGAKMRKHAADVRSVGAVFQPIGLTSMGCFTEPAIKWLKKFARVGSISACTPFAATFGALMTRLSVALWRGNAAMAGFGANNLGLRDSLLLVAPVGGHTVM